MGECKFDKSWIGRCKKETVEGTEYCTDHLNERCCQCKEQATHECEETFQFVCGVPLCDKEECKIKHHPQHHKLTPERWSEVYGVEVPDSLKGKHDKIDYKDFRFMLIRPTAMQITENIVKHLPVSKESGIRGVHAFGPNLYIELENGMSIHYTSDINK